MDNVVKEGSVAEFIGFAKCVKRTLSSEVFWELLKSGAVEGN
jgi:hypothetical protein